MTLCVAHRTKEQLFILSDTRIDDSMVKIERDKRRVNAETGQLKTAFISPSVVISYAGNSYHAHGHLQEFRDRHINPAQRRSVLNHFREGTQCGKVEYLIAFAQKRELYHLSDGVEARSAMQIIGSCKGIKRYNDGARQNPEIGNRMTVVGPMAASAFFLDCVARFQDVVEDPDVHDVGDFFTVAFAAGGQFRFANLATLYFDRDPKNSPIINAPSRFVATGENHAYRHSVWLPAKLDAGAVAFTFPEVELAYVFFSQSNGFADQCRVVRGTGENLLEKLNTITGLTFREFSMWHV